MKRDINLIKEILIEIEESGAPKESLDVEIQGRSPEIVSYHIMLMKQAGLVEAEDVSGSNSFGWIPISLTWQGHEFLDAIRNDTVWEKLKAKLKEQGGNIPFHVVKELAAVFSKDLLT
ncbi:DUF2513 domain-containing protein [Rhodohalobacter halophilus]|uniref:DUF2513 domain-containing protein n=1 Tax=Rhodohalobacter halophilus TaxID=1812810 RepID=UPI00083F6AAF|nr:DUF2513 domain-containing protein [Rhodohalobacter halophilus]